MHKISRYVSLNCSEASTAETFDTRYVPSLDKNFLTSMNDPGSVPGQRLGGGFWIRILIYVFIIITCQSIFKIGPKLQTILSKNKTEIKTLGAKAGW